MAEITLTFASRSDFAAFSQPRTRPETEEMVGKIHAALNAAEVPLILPREENGDCYGLDELSVLGRVQWCCAHLTLGPDERTGLPELPLSCPIELVAALRAMAAGLDVDPDEELGPWSLATAVQFGIDERLASEAKALATADSRIEDLDREMKAAVKVLWEQDEAALKAADLLAVEVKAHAEAKALLTRQAEEFAESACRAADEALQAMQDRPVLLARVVSLRARAEAAEGEVEQLRALVPRCAACGAPVDQSPFSWDGKPLCRSCSAECEQPGGRGRVRAAVARRRELATLTPQDPGPPPAGPCHIPDDEIPADDDCDNSANGEGEGEGEKDPPPRHLVWALDPCEGCNRTASIIVDRVVIEAHCTYCGLSSTEIRDEGEGKEAPAAPPERPPCFGALRTDPEHSLCMARGRFDDCPHDAECYDVWLAGRGSLARRRSSMDLLTWTPDDNNPERWRAAFGGSHGGPGIEFGVYYLAANDGGRGLFHLLVTLRFYDFSRLQEHEVHRDAYKEADESKAAAERWLRDWLGAAGAAAMRARAVELLRDERTEAQVALAIAAFAEAMLAGDAAEVDP